MTKLYEQSKLKRVIPFRTKRLTKDGRTLDVWITASVLVDEHERMHGIATTEHVFDPDEIKMR
jgi:two-component system CheB/CheR fusion protein